MRSWKNSLLILLAAAGLLAQTASQLATPEIRRVGDKLACLCGACKNTVATCQMLQCHYAHPARQKIARMLADGSTDQQIIDSFVKEHGLRALAVPPAEGFNLLGWIMPFVAIAAGLGVIWMFIRRFHRRRAPAAVEQLDPEALAQYRERIEKDLAKFD